MTEPANVPSKPTPPWRVREISDSRELRALAHPVRFALLDLLSEGPLTASQCGAELGESPANCSYHLRQLAKYGHVHAAEGGRGRERPWRIRDEGISWDPHSPAGEAASAVLGDAVDRYRFDAWRRYRLKQADEPREWRDTALSTDAVSWMTAGELAQFTQDLYDLFAPFRTRRDDPSARPSDARVVRFFAYAYGGNAGPLLDGEPFVGDEGDTASAADDT
ncbi:ArsR/SmtB family transcription factor [Demequina aurantiaca]|uniref:ArsR/SmtB family transcription factor n=1 Tax=Demequina aurantiaca TaxID=676200 RepID=UPI003D34B829